VTDAYLRRRDGGELPKVAEGLAPRMRALAARECCDYQPGGDCLRRGKECLLRSNAAHRCTWFEEAVVPLDRELQAELQARLSAKPLPKRMNGRDKKRLRAMTEAMDAVLDRQRWVSVDDVVRATGLSRRLIERILPVAIAELSLRKHRRGKEQWCLP